MNPEEQLVSMMRNQVAGIALGSVFLFIGLGAMAIAAIRHRRDIGLLLWFGVFSGLYGLRMLAQSPAAFSLLPQSVWPYRGYAIAVITYVILVPALLFWLELCVGSFRRFIHAGLLAAILLAVAAIGTTFIKGEPFAFMRASSVFTIAMMLLLAVMNALPSLARRFLKEQSPVLAAGSLVLVAVALLNNLGTFLPLPNVGNLEPIAFAVFVFSLGYVATQRVFTNERRLLAIENELEIAREIQQSILPTSVPQLPQLRVSAAYHPMTSVAGDFYEFIHLDQNHAGFLVADVSGHGVPAALIASMIKVAMHSVSANAAAPSQVMHELNQILSHQLRGQFVTAAYLYLDMESRHALYSGAGHPPLLHWNASTKNLQKIESNGLLFGVLKETDYPTCDVPFNLGDRFLLYTDGLIEAENQAGEAFGDQRLREVIASHPAVPAAELSALLLEELVRWQPQASTQQDDITLIVIDLV